MEDVVALSPALAAFNESPAHRAAAELAACCAAPEWVRVMAAGRPYSAVEEAYVAGATALAKLDWDQIAMALSVHPRIGQRAAGATREAKWSRLEQAGMERADVRVRSLLVEANHAYERRFGHVFLIYATGRTDTEMLAAARQRLDNEPDAERAVVRAELARIVDLRLRRLLA